MEFAGEGIVEIGAPSGTVYHLQIGDAYHRAILVLDGPGPIRFTVRTTEAPPDVNLLQVSGPDDDLREGLSGYSVEIDR